MQQTLFPEQSQKYAKNGLIIFFNIFVPDVNIHNSDWSDHLGKNILKGTTQSEWTLLKTTFLYV
jgi:hypothetical protein